MPEGTIYSIIQQILQAKFLKTFLATVTMALSYLFGDFDITVKALLTAMFLDFILGLSWSCYTGTFCKAKFKKGLYKIMLFMVALILGNMSDFLVFQRHMDVGFQNFIILYLGINEVLSCFRHLGDMGLKIPAKIIKKLERARDNITIE